LGDGVAVDDVLPNRDEDGNRLGRSVASLSVAALSVAGLAAAAAGAGAVPVFGNGAGTGSGTFSLTTGSAEAENTPKVATAIATMAPQQKPIMTRQRIGAIAIRPELAGRLDAIIPLPPMRCTRTPCCACQKRASLNARYGKFATDYGESSTKSPTSISVVVRAFNQDLPFTGVIRLADNAFLLHPFHQRGGTVVANLQTTLNIAGR